MFFYVSVTQIFKAINVSWVCWFKSIVHVLRSSEHHCYEYKVSLGYVGSSRLT